jgi:hypothetical protein
MLVDSDYRIESLEKDSAKKEFFELMKKRGYDMYDIDENSRLPKCLLPIIQKKDLNSFILFNNMLEKVHLCDDVSVIDMCTYLIEDFFEPEQLLTLLQTNLYDALRLELKKKNGQVAERFSKFLIK